MNMRVGIVGVGNIGAATVCLLAKQKGLLDERGAALEVTAVSARDRRKTRNCDLTNIAWVDDPLSLPARSDVDVVVELVGGAEGVALGVARAALNQGKHLVSGNKALIAAHGAELAVLAERNGLALAFEAAVGGAVPIIKLLRESMAANQISCIRGIMNGTCNYILTRMEEGLGFDEALSEAQSKGYAEPDPAADIDGVDAANKLSILTAVAFGVAPDLSAVFVEGIRGITPEDLKQAANRGGRIKLAGIAMRSDQGITQRVQPVFVPYTEALAHIGGVTNAFEVNGDFAGDVFIQGAGAGGGATASAVVADLIDITRGWRGFAFGVGSERLSGAN